MVKRPKEPERTVQETTVPHERASGYRVVIADGALVRRQKNDLLLTFYNDDAPVRSERAELVTEANGLSKVRTLGDFNQEILRSHEVTVRMSLVDAGALAAALLSRLSKEAPDVLKARGLEVLPEEDAQ